MFVMFFVFCYFSCGLVGSQKSAFLGACQISPRLKKTHQLRHSLGYDLDDFAIAKQS